MDKRETPAVVGGSSLLVIFAVLCLVVFALLSVSTVQADERLSQASAEAVSAYYQADCRAEEILARLRGGEVPEGVVQDGACYHYQCPVTENQVLQVTVMLTGDSYEVLQWQTVSVAQWDDTAALTVWNGTVGA